MMVFFTCNIGSITQKTKETMLKKAEAAKAQEQLGVKTRAKPRKQQYDSDVTGLRECYGGQAPFLPTPQGANMRHIRKPEPKEIEI